MTSHYTDHGALLIRNSDIKDGRFEFGDNPIYLDDEFAKQNASRKHKVGDVITVHTGDIGTSAVITEKEAGSIGFATIVTRPDKEKITSEYLCAYLNTDTHKNFAMNISTGDGRNNYNLKDYYECVVPVPSIAEQRKISSFIDELITLHQRKVQKKNPVSLPDSLHIPYSLAYSSILLTLGGVAVFFSNHGSVALISTQNSIIPIMISINAFNNILCHNHSSEYIVPYIS